MSRAKADELGVTPLGELVSYGQVAGPETSLLHQPSQAILRALSKIGAGVGDVDLFEINEAFAVVGLASATSSDRRKHHQRERRGGRPRAPCRHVGRSPRAHRPLRARRRGGGTAAVALCGGGGQGDAAVLRTIA